MSASVAADRPVETRAEGWRRETTAMGKGTVGWDGKNRTLAFMRARCSLEAR